MCCFNASLICNIHFCELFVQYDSALLYLLAIGAASVRPGLAHAVYVLVALMWLIPDRRIERAVTSAQASRPGAPGAA